MRDQLAFLCSIADSPDSEVIRLAFTDWLQEHDDDPVCAARLEFIRVQCELPRLHTSEKRYVQLKIRETKLRAANEALWRAGPRCKMCGGAGIQPPVTKTVAHGWQRTTTNFQCPDCHGGDAGGLMRKIGAGSVDITAGRLAGGWYHPVTFARGHIDAVTCTLAEVMERHIRQNDDDKGGSVEYRVTDWAKRVVRAHPVRRFLVTDKTPWELDTTNAAWWPADGVHVATHADLPRTVYDLLEGGEVAFSGTRYPTPDAANDALAHALARLVRAPKES